MGQVYLQDYTGPLYAFIEIEVGDLTVTTEDNGSFANDLGEVDKYVSNVTMSLAVTRASTENRGGSSWTIGNEFNLTIFDESACYVEDVIAVAMSNASMGASCRIEYGWSAAGRKIPERSTAFAGLILGYTLSFEGSSTVLSVEGTTTGTFQIGTDYNVNDIPDEITATGKPSEVVQYLVDEVLNKDGSGITYVPHIEETEPYYEDTDKTIVRNIAGNANSVIEYINKYLLLPAKSAETGMVGYKFVMEPDENDPNTVHVWYVANGVSTNFKTTNEKGETVDEIVYDAERGVVRSYSYYGDHQNSEVLSYSTDFKAYALNSGVSKVSSIDGFTNEMISVSTGDVTIGTVTTAMDACRLMGLSSGTYNALSQSMADLWTKYAQETYTASLEIMGDPNICVMDQIQLDVYTKFHQKHHTSGIYYVQSAEDSVDTSGFTTSLTLYKIQKLETRAIKGITEGEAYNNPVDERGYPKANGENETGAEATNGTREVLNAREQGYIGSMSGYVPTDPVTRGFPSTTETYVRTYNKIKAETPHVNIHPVSTGNTKVNAISYKGEIKNANSTVASPVTYKDWMNSQK